jgi:predicted component of type VI protein secretion system
VLSSPPVDDEEELTTRVTRPAAGPRPRPRRTHSLELTEGHGAPARVELRGDRLLLGRGDKVDIAVESEEVSRLHASFSRIDEEYQVEDLDSRNGVYLNGLRVHLALLREGDELQLGDIVYLYREGT